MTERGVCGGGGGGGDGVVDGDYGWEVVEGVEEVRMDGRCHAGGEGPMERRWLVEMVERRWRGGTGGGSGGGGGDGGDVGVWHDGW